MDKIIKRATDTAKQRKFWELVDKTIEEVKRMPKWKKDYWKKHLEYAKDNPTLDEGSSNHQ